MKSNRDLLQKLLVFAAENDASDIHLREGEVPVLRIHGDLTKVKSRALATSDMHEICRFILAHKMDEQGIAALGEVDGAFELQGMARFRFNVFRYDGKLGIVFRLIPLKVPTIDELSLPDAMKRIAMTERGFVLVTGTTGSGKSTTLAALIDQINSVRPIHIVTIEDPIEFVHVPRKARITQREVGRDTESFASALKSVLRQDPNVILVGEMRDRESVDMALKAAETGHTVFSTVHTTDVAKTIARLVSMFPPEEQDMVRLRLADNLKATIAQRLIKRADGRGRIAAQEIMVTTGTIRECIADPRRAHEMNQFVVHGREILGSQTFDGHLAELYRAGLITLDAAKEASSNAEEFVRALYFSKNEDGRSGPAGEATVGAGAALGAGEAPVELDFES